MEFVHSAFSNNPLPYLNGIPVVIGEEAHMLMCISYTRILPGRSSSMWPFHTLSDITGMEIVIPIHYPYKGHTAFFTFDKKTYECLIEDGTIYYPKQRLD